MTRTPATRIMDAAIRIADQAPATRGQYVHAAKITWADIIDLRNALDAAGIPWRGQRWHVGQPSEVVT